MTGSDDDVDDAVGHDDDLARRLAGHRGLHVGLRQRRLARRGLGGVARDLDRRAQLAVDLDRDLHRVVDEQGRIGDGPGLIAEDLPERIPDLLRGLGF